MNNSKLAAITFLLVCTGCGQGVPQQAPVSERDSAGVRVVVSAEPLWPPAQAWSVEEPALLEIGSAEGEPELQFHNVVGALRLSDGRIAIADASSRSVRFFSGAGAYLGASGRAGGGPGEFQTLSAIFRQGGDSVLAFDSRAARMSVISPTGEFSRVASLEPRSSRGASHVVGALSDGSLVVRSSHGSPAGLSTGVPADSVVYTRHGSTGRLLDSLALAKGEERYLRVQGNNVSVTTPIFGRSPVAAAAGEHVFLAFNDRYEVEVRTRDGALVRRVILAREPTPVTPAHVAAFTEGILANAAGDGAREHIQRTMAEIPVRETLPTFTRLLADEEGNLWMLGYAAPNAPPAAWSVFDPSGRWLGEVRLPELFRPMHVSSDEILGVWRDEFGVEYVRVYALKKPSR